MPRILILTAGFGEGHNTAAKSVAAALALEAPAAEVRVADPLAEGAPRLTGFSRKAYASMINNWPVAWQMIYSLADVTDSTIRGNPWLTAGARCLRRMVEDFRPDCVVTTYPLYVSFWEELFGDDSPCPLHTIITDSITINAVWVRGRSDSWMVTDRFTASRLALLGVPPEKISATGFPVSPRFSNLPRDLAPPAPGQPFRVLVFPIGSKKHTRNLIASLAALPASPAWTATFVLGKHQAKLQPIVEEARAAGGLPKTTEIIGWTDQVPELLASHHILLGKAGGATVHEARTAARPMLVHYVVPGQEEGNIQLLEWEGGGRLIRTPADLAAAWAWLTDNQFAGWSKARQSLADSAIPDPARRTARRILDSLSASAS